MGQFSKIGREYLVKWDKYEKIQVQKGWSPEWLDLVRHVGRTKSEELRWKELRRWSTIGWWWLRTMQGKQASPYNLFLLLEGSLLGKQFINSLVLLQCMPYNSIKRVWGRTTVMPSGGYWGNSWSYVNCSTIRLEICKNCLASDFEIIGISSSVNSLMFLLNVSLMTSSRKALRY